MQAKPEAADSVPAVAALLTATAVQIVPQVVHLTAAIPSQVSVALTFGVMSLSNQISFNVNCYWSSIASVVQNIRKICLNISFF